MEFEGKVTKRVDYKEGISSRKGTKWKKVEYIIEEVSQQYPQSIKFEVFGDCEKVDPVLHALRLNTLCKVYLSFNTEEYNGKYYTKIRAWKIEINGTDVMSLSVEQAKTLTYTPPTSQQSNTSSSSSVEGFRDSSIDDVPF